MAGKGYWIGRVDVNDLERYKDYVAANAAPFREHGAKFLVRGGRFESVEGESRARNVVIEFPSYEQAMALRTPVSVIDLIIIEGFEG